MLIKIFHKLSFFILLAIIIGGLFNRKLALIAIICMITPLVLSFFIKKRFWCKYLCPRGSFFDNVVSKLSTNRKTPKILRTIVYRLIVLILFAFIFIKGYENVKDLNSLGILMYNLVFYTTFIAVILSIFFNHRTWCTFCPIGSITDFISYLKKR